MKIRRAMLWSALALVATSACSDGSSGAPLDNPISPIVGGAMDSGTPPAMPAAPDTGTTPGQTTNPTPTRTPDTGVSTAPPAGDSAAVTPASDAGSGDAAPSSPDATSGEGGVATGANCLKGDGDFSKAGPYKFKMKSVTIGSKGEYTIVYPDPLETNCPHPFIAWGNGTFITGGTSYRPLQEHAASYGIITVASHNSNVGDGSFHKAAIDYMLEENKKMGSEFFGKVSPNAGVSGHSQGGAGGDRASNHMNVKANVNVQGSFGSPPAMSTAAFMCLTGTEDIAVDGCPMAVKAAKVPAISASYDGADHVSTTLGNGTGMDQYKRLYAAWFRCFLASDENACSLFKGGMNCPVCKDPGWDEIFTINYP